MVFFKTEYVFRNKKNTRHTKQFTQYNYLTQIIKEKQKQNITYISNANAFSRQKELKNETKRKQKSVQLTLTECTLNTLNF